MTWQAPLADEAGRHGSFTVPAHFTSGQTIGIVTVDLDYPKLPGKSVYLFIQFTALRCVGITSDSTGEMPLQHGKGHHR